MLSNVLVDFCQPNHATISSALAAEPTAAPTEIWRRLFGHHKATIPTADEINESGHALTTEELAQASKCGQWGPTQPSELFLHAYASALRCVDHDLHSGMVSPALLGSHGTVPLTIIAPLVDIARHMSNMIARAESEVLLVTCVWSSSVAVRLIHNALIELSKRAGARQTRVVVKVMYDAAGAPANFINPRRSVKPGVYSGQHVALPKPEDIPNIDLEVKTFHQGILGTIHAKFLVVDRKSALVMSNNMEDNDNMEMMAQVEGPAVDAIYDTTLISWGDALSPSLPCLPFPASGGSPTVTGNGENIYTSRGPARELKEVEAFGEVKQAVPEHTDKDPHYDDDISGEIDRVQAAYSPKSNESHLQAINRQLNTTVPNPTGANGPDIPSGEEFVPYIPISATAPSPIAMVSRAPYGAPDNGNVYVPQNAAWLSLIANAKQSIFIQTPDLNATPLYNGIKAALARGVLVTYYVCLGYNDPGEMMPGQGGTNEQFAMKLTASLSPAESQNLTIGYYTAKDQSAPIHHSFRSRSCHIKLLIADNAVGMQGSGNQDTQSWYHSQEMNLLIDSKEVCRKWREGIERNQSTARFGIAGKADGIWRDANGHEAPGATGNPSKVMGYVQGVIGMVKKAQQSGKLHA